MRGYSAYARRNRPRYYICYLSAETGDWKDEVTPYRVDDPAGKMKALRLAEQKAAEFSRALAGRRKEAWSAWVGRFLGARYGRSPLTLLRYRQAWDNLRTFLVERRVDRPAMLQYQHVGDYVAWRCAQKKHSGRPVHRNTAVFEVKTLGVIMREAVRLGFSTHNPCERAGLRKERAKEKLELTGGEIARIRGLLRALEEARPIGERWMTVSFEIALHQGCRLRETSLPLDDVDLQRGTITFRAKGYNGEPHVFTTALHPGLGPLMRELIDAGAKVTCTLPRMAAKLWWQFRQKNGLGHTTFHSTRVTVITRLARAGVPIQQAMRFVGHSSQAVHRIYQRLAAEDLSACTAALSFAAPSEDSPDARARSP